MSLRQFLRTVVDAGGFFLAVAKGPQSISANEKIRNWLVLCKKRRAKNPRGRHKLLSRKGIRFAYDFQG